jgi:hypothetical protein
VRLAYELSIQHLAFLYFAETLNFSVESSVLSELLTNVARAAAAAERGQEQEHAGNTM